MGMNTSVIKTPLESFTKGRCEVYAKLESYLPSGSLKDRMTGYALDKMMTAGELKKGDVVVEASSGNTGISLAKACFERGLHAIICVASHISAEKKNRIIELGAELKELSTSNNTEAEIEEARRLGALPGHVFFNQFENPYHLEGYKQTLVPELLIQLEERKVRIDTLLAGIGTGASIRAVGEELRKRHNPSLEVFGVSPHAHQTKIEGLHPGHVRGDFPIWRQRKSGFENGRILVRDKNAVRGAILLENLHGMVVGPCSGALYHALSLLPKARRRNVLVLFSDSGDRYQGLYRDYSVRGRVWDSPVVSNDESILFN